MRTLEGQNKPCDKIKTGKEDIFPAKEKQLF